jgi:cytidylate kinase
MKDVEVRIGDLAAPAISEQTKSGMSPNGTLGSGVESIVISAESQRSFKTTIAGQDEVSTQTEQPFIVTIDGPAASGKSSVSREIARRLGWNWVSTGAFYRGLAYVAYKSEVDLKDEEAVVTLARSANWFIRMTAEETCVFLNGQNVTSEIGKEEIGTLASKISSLPKVRLALLEAQRQCAKNVTGLVAEGRDCGTVVFPQAQVKVFLTARAEDRAARRALEEGRDLTKTIDEQKRRDAQDATRKTAPMQASADSNTIDTTQLSFLEVVEKVEDLVRTKLASISN